MNSAPTEPGLPRRTVVKGAAWSLPVLAVAIAAPAATASPAIEVVVDFHGACSIQGPDFRGPAFFISTAGIGLPAGTTIVITGDNVATAAWNLSGISPVQGFPANTVSGAPSGDTYVITFINSWVGGPIVFGAPMDLPTLTRFDGVINLPAGYKPAEGGTDMTAWITVSNASTGCQADFSTPLPPTP